MLTDLIQSKIRDIPDFPKPGIVFKDITPLLQDQAAFSLCIDQIATALEKFSVDAIVGIESRGFIFGPAVAYRMKKGFIPLRKKASFRIKQSKFHMRLNMVRQRLKFTKIAFVPVKKLRLLMMFWQQAEPPLRHAGWLSGLAVKWWRWPFSGSWGFCRGAPKSQATTPSLCFNFKRAQAPIRSGMSP